MIRTLTTSAAAICLMAGSAIAAPTMMTDAQMESQVAGETIFVETRSGKTVWTVTDLGAGKGFNNGGNGNTAITANGLLKAVGAGGLTLRVVE